MKLAEFNAIGTRLRRNTNAERTLFLPESACVRNAEKTDVTSHGGRPQLVLKNYIGC